MQYTTKEKTHIIKLEKGENVMETLTTYCKEHKIKNGYFRGIGAVEYVKCGYYALDEKTYHFTEYNALYEVVSATGNVMLKDDEPFIHLHAVFTDTTNQAFGGHVEEMRVGVTLEIILEELDTSISREYDEEIGLFLISCNRA